MDGYSIDSALIVRVLAKSAHPHRCIRCDTGMLVQHTSRLCVHCFNDLRTGSRADEEAEIEAQTSG